MNGTYQFVYSGAIGVGMGLFTVSDGKLVGCDIAGGRYSGNVKEDPATGNLIAAFDLFMPRGLSLVQGTSPLEFEATKPLTLTLPPAFGDGRPVELDVPPGLLTVMVKRAPDEWAPYSAGFVASVSLGGSGAENLRNEHARDPVRSAERAGIGAALLGSFLALGAAGWALGRSYKRS